MLHPNPCRRFTTAAGCPARRASPCPLPFFQPHFVGNNRHPVIGPGDIEIHRGKEDNRLYCIDFARLFPPEPVACGLAVDRKNPHLTRLLRPEQAGVTIHWPIDEIGTLAYHNVEKLFVACDNNNIDIVGAFPNPESDVLLLFKHRYLIEPHKEFANKGQLKRIKPRVSELSQKLQALQQDSKEVNA